MQRRKFITLIGGAVVWPLAATAQQPEGMPVVGFLFAGTMTSYARYLKAFRDGMRELGYDEGRNIRFAYQFADGYLDRLPGLAAELVSLKPSVIVSSPLPANLAAHRATSTIPIVMANGADPVGFGLVASLSHPGGNVTGLANFAELLASKQLDFLHVLLPRLSRVAMLVNINNPLHVPQLKEMQAAAANAGLDLVLVELGAPGDLEKAFAELAGGDIDALLVPPDTLFLQLRKQIADLAASHRLPGIYGPRDHVIDGGLMSYGPDIALNFHRAATFVDKVLKGTRPADLPVEQPNKIELVINIKTANALGIDIPAALLARADEVIE
jgi:putative ABC transport system substrate-binding protein